MSINTSRIVEELTNVLGTGAAGSLPSIVGSDPIGPSPHRIADASAAAIALFGQEVADLDVDRGAAPQTVTVTAADGFDQLRAAFLTTVNGIAPHRLTDDPGLLGLNDFYPTRDGWIFLLSTYPHLRAAVCGLLGCQPTGPAIDAACRDWDAAELEDAVVAAGGVAAAVRTAEQWAAHPVGRHLSGRPVIEVDRIGDADPRPLPAPAGTVDWNPLAGLRILDDTHVIAGPVAAKLLAVFGADVLHTSTPDRPDPIGMTAITGGGKRNAYLDVTDAEDWRVFDSLVGQSDVMVSSYRGLSARGLGPLEVAERHPGVIAAELHCWGADGPWAGRGGFDQLAVGATGFALEEGAARGTGVPHLPPTHLLNDYLAAYLCAAGIVAALRRRAIEGGSWRVRVNLARVCTWVRDLGTVHGGAAVPDPVIARHTVAGPFGTVVEPVVPIAFSRCRTPRIGPATLLGTAAPSYLA